MLLIICAYISYNNKTLDKYIFGSSDLKNTNLFAIMIEDANGEYKESSLTSFPGYDYFYNQEKSSCMDMSGKPITDSLLYNQDTKTATITIGDTSSCYLYFDTWKSTPNFASKLIESNVMWQSGLDGDGYRFTGTGSYSSSTTPSNFICFGTFDKSTCTSNPDKYMYRIIGVFDGYIKLIKLTSLTSNLQYAGAGFSQISDSGRVFANSVLKKELNGTSFLTNTTYDYLQNTTWSNKIAVNTKKSVNTTTYTNSGPNYYNSVSPSQIYLHEYNKSGNSNTNGEWSTYNDKITVMDASDYVLSLGSTAKSMTTGTYTNRNTLKTSWLFLGNNKYGNTSGNYTTEQTTASYGIQSTISYIYSWTINPSGYLYQTSISNSYAVRPVFYLTKDTTSNNGTGTLSDPYLIDEVPKGININLSNTDNILSIKITDDYSTQLKYCVNNSSSISGCEWKNVNSSNISYNMTDDGTYYVHVIDSLGYINHNSFSYVASDSYNFVLAMPEKCSDIDGNYLQLQLMPSAEKLGTRPDVITEEDITIYGVKAENMKSSDIINTSENGIIHFPSNFETQNSFPSLFDALYTWYYNLTGGDFNEFEYGFYTPYTINNTRYDGIYQNKMFGDSSVVLDTDEITYWQGYKWIFYEVPPGSNFDVLNPDSQYRINFVTKKDTTLPIYQLINNVKLRGNYTYYGIYEYYEVYSE